MDIDLSKVVLIVLAVLPGYLARRGSDRVLPGTQRKKGTTEEIAAFLIFSVTVHFILALFYGGFWTLAGLFYKHAALFFIGGWLQLNSSELLKKLGGVAAGYLAIYLCLSLCLGWLLGLGRGLFDVWRVPDRIARAVSA